MAFIYLLHVDSPLSHAEHYAGSTEHLKDRLTRHANGQGARITRAFADTNRNWRLAALGVCAKGAMKRVERSLKDTNNLPRYCPICNPQAGKIPGTTPYDVSLLRFAATAEVLGEKQETPKISLRLTQASEPPTTMALIKKLMRSDKDSLGFIPAGGAQGLQVLFTSGRIAIAKLDQEDVGYANFTLTNDRTRLNIHQCCVADAARNLQVGRSLVEFIARSHPFADTWAKVRADLPACVFWNNLGFEVQRSEKHPTSGSTIHHFHRPAVLRRS